MCKKYIYFIDKIYKIMCNIITFVCLFERISGTVNVIDQKLLIFLYKLH